MTGVGEGAMIFHLSEKLNAKIRAGTLATLPPDENPFADWSAGLFFVGRSQYRLLTNTKSLYSTVLQCKGITDEKTFVERALSSIREFMDADGQEGAYERLVAPFSGSVQFAKALNRSVGSFSFRQLGQNQGAGVLTGFGLRFRHLAQR
jgi:hypothetical protein